MNAEIGRFVVLQNLLNNQITVDLVNVRVVKKVVLSLSDCSPPPPFPIMAHINTTVAICQCSLLSSTWCYKDGEKSSSCSFSLRFQNIGSTSSIFLHMLNDSSVFLCVPVALIMTNTHWQYYSSWNAIKNVLRPLILNWAWPQIVKPDQSHYVSEHVLVWSVRFYWCHCDDHKALWGQADNRLFICLHVCDSCGDGRYVGWCWCSWNKHQGLFLGCPPILFDCIS